MGAERSVIAMLRIGAIECAPLHRTLGESAESRDATETRATDCVVFIQSVH
jgi:hypothetical protein